MISIPRLKKALRCRGLDVDYQDGVYTLRRPPAEARVLLPADLPLEEKAVIQLMDFASVSHPGHPETRVLRACATPDFHPGTLAPVGSIVATSDDFVIPAIPGTDINCGMRLLTTGLTLDQAAGRKDELVRRLRHVLLEDGRDVPLRSAAYAALFADGPAAFLDALHDGGLWGRVNKPRLAVELDACVGMQGSADGLRHAPPALVGSREMIRDPSIGTPGSGNHFVELQVVDAVLDRTTAWQQGIKVGELVVMIHSGSRDVGFFVGGRWMDRARADWPGGLRHPESGLYGLAGPLARDYLDAMGVAARYAWANRMVLGELVRDALSATWGETASRLVVDVPHNTILREHGMNIHRKGSTPAHAGDLALIPGSMGDYSYLVAGLGHPDWLWSCSHGAGRSMRRQAARAALPTGDHDHLPMYCVTLREERLLEEAPAAYKKVGAVIDAQESAGLIRTVARLKPWITFKA